MSMVSLAASIMLSAPEHWFADKAVLQVLNAAVSPAIFTLLFVAIYKLLPDTAIYWCHLVLGAFVTALLFVVANR